MLDFARAAPSAGDLGASLTRLVDDAIVARQKAEYAAGRGAGTGDVAAKRIGAGYIGTECDRALAHRYHKTPKDERASVVSPGELQRHALAGFWTEGAIADWLRLAGFDLRTLKPDGTQYGYHVARDPETGQARIAGEIDGVIVGVPAGFELPLPCLWESKKATHKKATKFAKEGVAKADEKYHGQVQTNMAYLEVGHTLFSMLDLDTMKIYWELIVFDPAFAQRLTDRAIKVLESRSPEEMPRIAREPTDYRCRFCDYAGACWKAPAQPETVTAKKPAWLTGAP